MISATRAARTALWLCAVFGWMPTLGATVDNASPLLAIDRNRDAVVDRIVKQWGDALSRTSITTEQLREMLLGMRADQLLAASLVGSLDGLRDVIATSLIRESEVKPSLLNAKALGDANQDVVYVPVTPCRLVETRGTFAAVYQGGGAFTTNQIRTYTVQGGNGVCLTQLPASVSPSAVQIQVYGIPTTAGSGDIEILPQGGTFGSTATLVYLGNNAFTSASTTAPVNLANKQISVQVRGGGAHVAIDVVGYFRAPAGGYVSSVTAGLGLTGGGTGAVNLAVDTAAIQSRVTGTCAAGSSIRAIAANGTVTCETDDVGTGTVTSVGSGTGLTGGPITTTGTLSLATGYQLPQGCANGQVAKSNGSNAWTCASDTNSGGTVTSITAGNGLTGGTITTSGTIAVDPTSTALTSNFFRQGGNAFGATAVLGTTDNNAIDVNVNNSRVIRYEPNPISPNVLGGSPANNITAGVRGATIGGGGTPSDPAFGFPLPNRVTDAYGTVGGGAANVAGDDTGTAVDRPFATVGGGWVNIASGRFSTVVGGYTNTASGEASTVAGGGSLASGNYSTVPGGFGNVASGDLSLAAGQQARSLHLGTFAWADAASAGTFDTLVSNEFAVRSTGGARFVTAIDGSGNPTRAVSINPNGELAFGNQVRQMLNLYGPAVYGIGVQASTLYARTDNNFAWFLDGVHSDNMYDPGAGGLVLATLQPGASATAVFGVFRAQVLTQTSDEDAKADFVATDTADILEKVVTMPISTWSYKTEHAEGTRHIGPTAQDFKARFNVGYDDKTIATVDADGVALAAIQGLNAKFEAQSRVIEAQQAQIAELRRALEVLAARLATNEQVASR